MPQVTAMAPLITRNEATMIGGIRTPLAPMVTIQVPTGAANPIEIATMESSSM